MWQRLSKRERLLLIVMAMVAALFVGYRFVWLPLLGSQAGVLAEMDRTRALLEDAREAQAMLPVEMKKIDQAQQAYDQAVAGFSADVCDGGALVGMGLYAERLGLRVTGYHSLQLRVHEHYLELPVLFEMHGPYPMLLSFIDGIEKRAIIPNVVQMRKMRVEQMDENQSAGTEEVKAQLYLIFYSDTSPRSRLAMAEIASWKLGREDTFAQAPLVSPYADVKARGVFGQPEGNDGRLSADSQGGLSVGSGMAGAVGASTRPTQQDGAGTMPTGENWMLPSPLPITTPQEPIPPNPSLDG